jgi:beta-lactamase regulating signal transducer with metallopeptidase domain
MSPSIETLLTFADQVTLGLWAWSWQALILLVCVWAGLSLLRVQSPALRHHIWLLGLLMVAVLPFGTIAARLLPNPTPQPWHGEALRYATELPRLVIAPLPWAEQLIATNTVAPTDQPVAKRSFSFGMLAFCAWLIGVCALFVGLLRDLWRLHRIRLSAEPVSAAALGCAARLDEAIPLRLSAAIHSPVLHGVVRPLILLPHDLTEWTTVAERSAMIEHELAHLRRRDHYTNLFLNALNVIFYFHPLVRYACRQIRLEREFACDDCVVGTGTDATAYAESILKAAERCLAKPAVAALHQPAFFTSKQTLERRLEMIMNTNRVRVLTAHWRYLVLPVVLLAALSVLLLPNRSSEASPPAALQTGAPQNLFLDPLKLVVTILPQGGSYKLNTLEISSLSELTQQLSTALRGRPADKNAVFIKAPEAIDEEVIAKVVNAITQAGGVPFRPVMGNNGAQNDFPPPPPPPPPPAHFMMTVEAGKPLAPLPGHPDDLSAFGVLRQLADAHIRRDTSVFERLFADNYIGYGPNGESFNKAEELAEVKKLDYTVTKFEFDDLHVMGNEGISVASFLGTVYYQASGQDATVQYRYTATMVRLRPGGPLRVVSVHMSRKA